MTFVLFALLRVIILTSGFLLLYLSQIFREYFSVFDVDLDHHLGESLLGIKFYLLFICRILS